MAQAKRAAIAVTKVPFATAQASHDMPQTPGVTQTM
jgi:hypothetical protein